VRLGEVSSLKGATTAQGSTGGFWGGVWLPGNGVASWGRTGSWRIWWNETPGGDNLRPGTGISGATRAVKDLSWDKKGRYLLCVSLDQTTRMLGRWVRGGWHEIARPQIHGYDLNTVSTLPEWKFVSGAEEKVIRVFQMSKDAAELVLRLGDLTDNTDVSPRASPPG
jgi:elongator complex protein 2